MNFSQMREFVDSTKKCPHVIRTKSTDVKSPSVLNVWWWWEGSNVPPSVRCAVNTWKHYFSQRKIAHKIRKLDLSNVARYVYPHRIANIKCLQGPAKQYALQTDYVRLCVLERMGGLYMDATVFLIKDASHLLDMDNASFVAFFSPFNTRDCKSPLLLPSIENSLLYSKLPDFPLIRLWVDEMTNIRGCTMENMRRYHGEDTTGQSLFKVLHRQPKGIQSFDGIVLWNGLTYDYFYMDMTGFMTNPLSYLSKQIKGDEVANVLKSSGPIRNLSATERKRLDTYLTHRDVDCSVFTKELIHRPRYYIPKSLFKLSEISTSVTPFVVHMNTKKSKVFGHMKDDVRISLSSMSFMDVCSCSTALLSAPLHLSLIHI